MTDVKILIVEDDEKTRKIYADILRTGGYEVDTAADGQEGLEKLKNTIYSLILLDIMMPKVDGLQFLTAFKNNNNSGKVVVFTNLSHATIVEEAKKLGADDFIVKSDMNPDKLLAKIKNML